MREILVVCTRHQPEDLWGHDKMFRCRCLKKSDGEDVTYRHDLTAVTAADLICGCWLVYQDSRCDACGVTGFLWCRFSVSAPLRAHPFLQARVLEICPWINDPAPLGSRLHRSASLGRSSCQITARHRSQISKKLTGTAYNWTIAAILQRAAARE
jgi:hypothetical protein